MKQLKHSKVKNTGVLFELLVRQVASDTLNNTDSSAIGLLKKYFGKNTELSKELNLYQTAIKEQFNKEEKASSLIEALIAARKQLNESALSRQKYNLIKEIKENYILEDFFKTKVNDYKVLASIYKLFEYQPADNPSEFVTNKYTLIEHVVRTNVTKPAQLSEMALFTQQNKDVRILTYKLLVDKFNEKYSELNEGQKRLLRNYINSITESTDLKNFLDTEIATVTSELNKLTKSVTDKVVKIKLKEVTSLLTEISKAKSVKDNHVLSLLRYHELIKELKKV
jgi:hypothetical protein